jgi:thiamine pyrophosphokinase
LTEISDDDLIISADGGAQHCIRIGLTPTVVIGDMDSITPSLVEDLKSQNVQFITYPRDKNETDLELALSYAVQKGVDQILFQGLLGGRLDQTLANLLLLTRDEWKYVDLVVSQGPDIAYLMRDEKKISLRGKPGDIVALIPVCETVTGVTAHGLRWKLENADLVIGNTLSVSNEMIGSSAWVKIGSGKLFLIHRNIQAVESED